MNYICPVCGYPELHEKPENYEICPCCFTEFGNDDYFETTEVLRQKWIDAGMQWCSESTPKPLIYNPSEQLESLTHYPVRQTATIAAVHEESEGKKLSY